MKLLEMKNICKAFNGVPVLKNVELSIEKGEVHALMGENGAGKSTLMNVLTGVYKKDDGEITFDGRKWSRQIYINECTYRSLQKR